jgi:hypothetical protein
MAVAEVELPAEMGRDFGRFPFFGVSAGETFFEEDDEEHSRVNSAHATFL